MRPDRTTSFLVILAIIAALLLGLTVGGAGPMTWLGALAGGGAAPEAEVVPATATRTPRPSATATEEPTARPSPTPRPTRTPRPTATATAEPTPEPSATPEPTPEPPPPPTEAPPEPPAPEPTVTLAATTRSPVNFREAPTADSALIASLSGGTPLTLLGRNASATWLRARLEDGREGWLTSAPAIIAVEGDIQALAVIE